MSNMHWVPVIFQYSISFFAYIVSVHSHNNDVVGITLVLQIKGLRLQEVKWLSQGHRPSGFGRARLHADVS